MSRAPLTKSDLEPLMRPGVRLTAAAVSRMVGRTEAEVAPLLVLVAPKVCLALPAPARRPPPPPIIAFSDLHIPRAPWRITAGMVAMKHGLSLADLIGPSRRRKVARPRQEAFAAVQEKHGYSLPKIGRLFGGRDHTTVLHGIREHAKRVAAAAAAEPGHG